MPSGFRVATAFVVVEPDTTGFDEKLHSQLEKDKAEARVKATPDATGFKEKLQAAVERDKTEAKVKVTADTSSVERAAAQAKTVIDGIAKQEAKPKVKLETGDLDAKAEEAKAKLDELGHKDAHAKVSLDDGDFKEKAASDSAAADNASHHISLIGLAVAGITLAIPAAGGALGALAGAGGTAALSFMGVKQALTDATAAQNAMGQSAAQVAATEFSNSVAIRGAEQSVADAKRAAAQQAISSAESVANAEQGLQNAIISEQFAQRSLTQARKDAALTLQQLNNDEKDSKLSVEAATLALQQAELNAKQINQSNVTTSLQRSEANLAVQQAQQALTEAGQKATNATAAANLANKQGVEGSPSVLQAKNAERLALVGISGAQQSLADAVRNSSNSQISSQEAVSKAVQGLSDTLKQQQLQAAVTAASNAQAATQFQRDMAKMTGAGRTFVEQLLGMKTELHALSATAQTAFLPGVTSFLQSTHALMPVLNTEIRQMGGILGSQFTALGNAVKSSGFQTELRAIFAQANQLVSVFVPALGQMAGAFMHLLSVGGAASAGLTKGLTAIANGFGGLFKALEPSAAAFGSILSTIGQAIGALGPPLGQVVGALAGALAPALAALLPGFKALVAALGQGLAAALRGMTPLLTLVAQAIGSIATAIAPVLPVLGRLIGEIATSLAGALKPLLPVIQTLAKTLAGELSIILPVVANLLIGLIKSLAPLFPLLGPIATMVSQLALQLGGVLGHAIMQLTPSIVGLVSALVGLAVKVLPPLLPMIQHQLIPAFLQMVIAIVPILPQLVQLATSLVQIAVKAAPTLLPFLLEGIKLFFSIENRLMSVITWVAHFASGLLKLAISGEKAWGQLLDATKRIFGDVWNFLKKIWTDITKVFNDAWNWLKSTWKSTTDWVWNLWQGWLNNISKRARTVWDDLRSGVTTLWNDLKRLFNTGVSALGTIWKTLEGVFKAPVNFLISTVYMGGIRRLWDDVVNAIGMKSLDLPSVSTLAGGGVIPGYAPGHDTEPALLSKGEGVLVPEAVRAIGPDTVHALNAAYGKGRHSNVGQYAGGGIVGGLMGGLSSIVSGAKFLTDFMMHPASSMTSLLDKVVSTDAKGDLGKVMTGIPIALIKDLAKYIATAGASGGAMAMVNLAKTQVGTAENPPGSNNQKYSTGIGRSAEAWCADFIDWLAQSTGNKGVIPWTASAPGMAQGFGSQFQSGSSGILPGDIVFYSGASNGFGGIGHVGIAVTGGNTWQSVEGNYGDHVALNTRSSAQGHARPKYPVTGGPGGTLIHASPSTAQAWAQQALMSYGWGNGGEYSSLVNLWNRESGWRWDATNPSSGAYGIPQSLPASKMGSAGGDWHDNAATQMRWGLGYIQGRYGSPSAAMAHENSAGWYDQGGYLPPGMSRVMNATGKPEAVLDPRQTAALERLADALTGMSGGGTGAAGVHQENHFHGSSMASPEELAALKIHLATAIAGA